MKINDYQIARAERVQTVIDDMFRQQNAKIDEKVGDLETQLLDTQEGVVELYNMISREGSGNG